MQQQSARDRLDALKAEKASLSSLITQSSSAVVASPSDSRVVYQKLEDFDRRKQDVSVIMHVRARSRRTSISARY